MGAKLSHNSFPKEKGFLLTSDWLDIAGKHYLRFLGTGTMGSFELVVTDFQPYFFIPADCQLPKGLKELKRKPCSLQTYTAEKVDQLFFRTYGELLRARKLLEAEGFRTFEADIKPTDRYLMDQAIHASFDIKTSEGRANNGGLIRYKNPVLERGNYEPSFQVLSLDIETSKSGRVLSIGLHGWNTTTEFETRQVLILGPLNGKPRTDVNVISFDNEKKLLEGFNRYLQLLDPDIVIGWNIVEFDLSFLMERCKHYKIGSLWGKLNTPARITPGSNLGKRIHLNGRVVIDGPATLRLAFYQFEDFKLETVARKLLGRGKDIIGKDSWDEIEKRFREDKHGLAYYNIEDCILVSDIFKTCDLIHLQATRSQISGLLMNRVGVSTAAFDHFFVPKSHLHGLVANNVKDTVRLEHAAGGHVLDPKVGLYEHVVLLDFKSLYPSILRTFKIDPVSRFWGSKEGLKTPTGHIFSQKKHCLPEYISELLAKRKVAKEQKNSNLSQTIKILMNSFYGVMGSGGSRFYHPDLPNAITGTGRWILKESEKYFENKGYQVIYGDTDSVFVVLNTNESASPFESGEELASGLNKFFQEKLLNEFSVRSELEVEFEKYYRQFFLPPSRSKTGGSKKRYVGQLVEGESSKIEFTGLEFVRSDWTKLAKDFQYGLIELIFAGDRPQGWIEDFLAELRSGKRNQDLVYSRRLVKPLEDYTKTRPPHVKAAAMLDREVLKSLGRRPRIKYLMTQRGPIPTALAPKDIDYEHYIEKQLKPIADTVLWMYGEKFSNLFEQNQKCLF